jgi:hypothetical protein
MSSNSIISVDLYQAGSLVDTVLAVSISHMLPMELTRYCHVQPEQHIFNFYRSDSMNLCLGTGSTCGPSGCSCNPTKDPSDLCGETMSPVCSVDETECTSKKWYIFAKEVSLSM